MIMSLQQYLHVLLCVSVALAISSTRASSVINLGESSWVVTNGNGSLTAKSTLPAYPLEILRANGVVKDPLYRYGELETRWVALDRWDFTLKFSGSSPEMKKILAEKQVVLKLGGVDTFATITLNDEKILDTNNFHRHWTVPVKDVLKEDDNELIISIRPAMYESLKLKEQHPYTIPALHQMGAIGAYNFMRKPASDGGWDWGPAYLASGVHGNVELLGFSNAVLESTYVHQHKVQNKFELAVTSELLVPPGGDVGTLEVAIPELKLKDVQKVKLSQDSSKDVTPVKIQSQISVNANEVELWWPSGYGPHKLYNVTVTYTPSKPAGCTANQKKKAATATPKAAPAAAMQDVTPATAGSAAAVPVGIASFTAPEPTMTMDHSSRVGMQRSFGIRVSAVDSMPDISMMPGAYVKYDHDGQATPTAGTYGVGHVPGTYLLGDPQQSYSSFYDEQYGSTEPSVEEYSSADPAGSDNGDMSNIVPPEVLYIDGVLQYANPSQQPSAAAQVVARGSGSGSKAADAPCADAAVSTKTYKTGFRTVELVRLPISEAVKDLFPEGATGWDVNAGYELPNYMTDRDQGVWALSGSSGKWQWYPRPGNQSDIEGESFYFKVNGVPIYMKGSNLVPMNILPTNVTKETITDLVDYAVDSNMNMIRIWGGGLYPVTEFIEYCDEKGMLLWMETMFACSPYPRDVDFLSNVAEEVRQQLTRSSWHPSVAAWSGNNEIENSAWWFSETRANLQLYTQDYISLFIDTIHKVLREVNPSIPFVDASPSNGAIVDTPEQYVKRWGDHQDPRYGDIHYYAYDMDCEDFTTYPKAKFVSEFGSQSYPTFQTYAAVTSPEDWQVDNNMTGFRNRRFGNGLEVFEAQFSRHFRLPAKWTVKDNPEESLKLFKSFVYITHMQQARCYETAINYWRRLRSQPAGLTMGVLYWQLNDIAEYASWSSFDYGGRWKPLAYAVKRMYAPMQVQAVQDKNLTQIFIINDHTKPVDAAITLQLRALNDSSATCQQQQQRTPGVVEIAVPDADTTLAATIPPGYASPVMSIPTAELMKAVPSCTLTTCYLEVTAKNKMGDVEETSEAQLFYKPLKDLDLPDPELKLSEFKEVKDSGAISFKLTSTQPAVLTSFSTKYKGRFSDDAFTAVHPCKPKEIVFYPHSSVKGLKAKDLEADLSVESLFNHQYGTAAKPARPPKSG